MMIYQFIIYTGQVDVLSFFTCDDEFDPNELFNYDAPNVSYLMIITGEYLG